MDAFLILNGAGATVTDNSLAWTIIEFVAVLALIYSAILFAKNRKRNQQEINKTLADTFDRQKLYQELIALQKRFDIESAGLSAPQKKMLWNPVEKALKQPPSSNGEPHQWLIAAERARQALDQVRRLKSLKK
jgi:hypothetical protein